MSVGAARWRYDRRSEAQSALFQADELMAPDDDVVEQLDVEQRASLAQLLGRADILGRGGRVA